jgi:hypothetical protein
MFSAVPGLLLLYFLTDTLGVAAGLTCLDRGFLPKLYGSDRRAPLSPSLSTSTPMSSLTCKKTQPPELTER